MSESNKSDLDTLFNTAVQEARKSFDPEAAYRAARKLLPKLEEREQRKKGYEILFAQVLEALQLTADDEKRHAALLEGIAQAFDDSRFWHRECELKKQLETAELAVPVAFDALHEARLALALQEGTKEAVQEGERLLSEAKSLVERLKEQLKSNAQQSAENATQREQALATLKAGYQLLDLFREWKIDTLRNVKTHKEMCAEEEEERRREEAWERMRD